MPARPTRLVRPPAPAIRLPITVTITITITITIDSSNILVIIIILQSGVSRIRFIISIIRIRCLVPRMFVCVAFSCLAILRIEGCLTVPSNSILGVPYLLASLEHEPAHLPVSACPYSRVAVRLPPLPPRPAHDPGPTAFFSELHK